MKRSRLLLVIGLLISFSGIAQKEAKMLEVLNKYFLYLPYNKNIADWLQEYRNIDSIRLDSINRENPTEKTMLLKALIANSTTFAKTDSLKIYIGSTVVRGTTTTNGNIVSEQVDSILYLRHIYYFPLQRMTADEFKQMRKNVIKEFGKHFAVSYPTSSRPFIETVWFSTNYGMPPNLIVTMEYGKLKERSLYYIYLTLRI